MFQSENDIKYKNFYDFFFYRKTFMIFSNLKSATTFQQQKNKKKI